VGVKMVLTLKILGYSTKSFTFMWKYSRIEAYEGEIKKEIGKAKSPDKAEF